MRPEVRNLLVCTNANWSSARVLIVRPFDLQLQVLSQAGVKLSIIGCGDWEMIEGYKSELVVNLKFLRGSLARRSDVPDLPQEILSLECDVYANPSGSLYQILGMRQSSKVKTDIRNFYIQGGFLSMVARSVKNALAMGNVTKNGGEVSRAYSLVWQRIGFLL